MQNNTFIFNIEWYTVLLEYPAEVRFEVYEAIMRYAASGTLPELKPLAKMAFSFIKKEMDYNRRQYEETVEKRREAGRRSAEAKANARQQSQQVSTNPTLVNDVQQIQQKATSPTHNDNANDNVNELSSTTTNARARVDDGVDVELQTDEKFLDRVFADTMAIEAFCMANKIKTDKFRAIAEEIVNEWRLIGQRHQDEKDARRHLISQARIKLNSTKPNETKQTDKFSERRGTQPSVTSRKGFKGTF